jgi:phage/plasmid-like protein (TIGR03299 family)
MAHNLATINGSIAMMYQNASPWHGLGKRISGTVDVQTALTAATLDWTVRREALYLADGRKLDERFATVRDLDNAILGTVGPDYTILQNADAFGILNDVCAEFGVTIETAGALGKGERVWMLAKMPEPIEPIAGDKINGYALVMTGHTGTQSYVTQLTPIRVVCQNTLNAATASGQAMLRIRHTSSSPKRLDEAKRLMNSLTKALHASKQTYGDLARQAMTPQDIAKYIETVFPTPAGEAPNAHLRGRRDQVAALVFAGRGADMANQDMPSGTASAWAAYNAVTEYFDHVRPAEAKSASARQSANESAIFGSFATVKLNALQIIRQQLVAA